MKITPYVRRAVALAAVPLLLAVSACSGGSGGSSSNDATPDSGAQLTMWVRSATNDFSQRLVKGYNKTHKNQVKLTVIPNDSYLQKVGAAAGANSLPDILAADVVYSPNYTKQGLFADITDRVKGLSFAGDLAQAHISAATKDGKIYAVPHKLDSSVLFYNKDLFKKAGLDPNQPPKSFNDIYKDAKAVNALGGKVKGFYFGGNCGGCTGYTTFPNAWAAGSDVISADGRKADIDSAAFKATFALYKRMYDEGIVASGAKTEDGSTWSASFVAGKVGIVMNGSPLISSLQSVKFDWGVAPLGSPDGSATSTFVGGDVAGISRSSKNPAQAWDFLAWTLGEDAQVQIIAKNGDLPDRTDLVDNQYTSKDARTKLIADGLKNGHTPATLPFGELFNDPNGPWVAGFRGAIFGHNPDAALAEAQSKIQAKIDSAY
ncbi:MAG: ABC transporter substrate-binding protein [Propionibacteriaceae bacterium]